MLLVTLIPRKNSKSASCARNIYVYPGPFELAENHWDAVVVGNVKDSFVSLQAGSDEGTDPGKLFSTRSKEEGYVISWPNRIYALHSGDIITGILAFNPQWSVGD